VKRYPFLDVCSRVEGHAFQHKMLRQYCSDFHDWEGLLECAEREGLTPLLRKHLLESGSAFPGSVRRSLNILYKRHQHEAMVRTKILQEILELFQNKNLTPILIKGATLAYTVYPDPALRPMRDMDILFHNNEVDLAQELLKTIGFKESTAPIPPDHHHLPSLFKKDHGTAVCIELHRGLYPDCQPFYPDVDFDELLATACKLKICNSEAFTFSNEEMLHYLYQHTFRAPLTYESYKLINVADIIGFTELNYSKLDWNKIQNDFPLLHNALSLVHHIAQWDFSKVPADFVSSQGRKKKMTVTPFRGWPKKRLKEWSRKEWKLYQILRDTLFPSCWWLKIYYGINTRRGYLWCLLWHHPRHIFWWARLYVSFMETEHSSPSPNSTQATSFSGLKICRVLRGGIALLKKVK
jgi:hypothetical protein